MSDHFYEVYHDGLDLDLLEIAAQHDLNPATLSHFEEWFKEIRDSVINEGRNPTEKKLFITLLKDQPEFKQARTRVNSLKTQLRGY